MVIEKIFRGVLAMETEYGVRYVQPSLFERIRLTWTFRNFRVLPQSVMKRGERALIDSLCRNGQFLVNGNGHGDLSLRAIGTVERTIPREQPRSAIRRPPACVQRTPGALPHAS